MLVMCESMLALAVRTQELFDQGKASIGQIGRIKSYNTQLTREVCQMAREICGGNGILLENHVIKAMLDIESIHTYEGTYEVNMLVSGREITGGMQAFK
jgi:alkylation response protein AidB-like acyl-CoA dehydrogenase